LTDKPLPHILAFTNIVVYAEFDFNSLMIPEELLIMAEKRQSGQSSKAVVVRRNRAALAERPAFQNPVRKDQDYNKEEIVSAINRSVSDLYKGLEMHQCLMATILEKNLDRESVDSLLSFCPSRNRENRLRDAIKEAIDVLEESRKAFKSKRLETLRKSLTQILIESKQ